MYKFLTDATPFHTITTVGGGMINLALIPFYHRNNGSKSSTATTSSSHYRFLQEQQYQTLSRAYKDFTHDFASTVAFETLNTTSKVTKYMADVLNKAANIPNNMHSNGHGNNRSTTTTKLNLPNRPNGGVPHNEYEKNGTSGAITSLVRNVPVAVLAPLSGASEAFSYLCVGVRNQMRPDVRKEEEACLRGLMD